MRIGFCRALENLLALTSSMATSSAEDVLSQRGRKNRLAGERSPYLLQHASNPVNWFPWGKEAFEKAVAEDKPIFLSVGYSTCHWCHVMERESFTDPSIGALLDQHFVSVKVDREERPDVDRVYMTFVQATQGGGGWPMSVFLTPELKPFLGGTYFPPRDTFGRPGFSTVLKAVAKQWSTGRDRLISQSKIIDAISEALAVNTQGDSTSSLPESGCVEQGFQTLEKVFDEQHGGFGAAPKFPQPVNLDFLLRVYSRHHSSKMGKRALEMSLATLKAMAKGGMHDHIGQGFHRYSTDKYWHVPHFEKMLYDQGQLACVYADAYQITKDKDFADTLKDILLYVSRDLSDEDGGFYSAEDADSFPEEGDQQKKEGAFCVWKDAEIRSILSEKLASDSSKTLADLFCFHYGVKASGNVSPSQDPHKELVNQNVLIVRGSLSDTASHFSIAPEEASSLLDECRAKLFAERLKRPKPHRDEKILSAWNGLMISGFARAAQALSEASYLRRAIDCASFVEEQLYDKHKGVLLRSGYRDSNGLLSVGAIEGFADDYAFVVGGLLDLFEASQDQRWLELACKLQDKQDELFWDEDSGGYFSSTSNDPSILLHMKEDQDGAEPSPNSVSAHNLLRMSCLLNRSHFRDKATSIFKMCKKLMTDHPAALPMMLSAYVLYMQSPMQVVIAGKKDSADTAAMLTAVNSRFIPNKAVIVHEPGSRSFLSDHLEILHSVASREGKATAYLCEDFKCSAPINSLEELEKVIQ